MIDAVTTDRPATAIAEYSPTAAALADLRARYQGVVWDVTTTKGDKEARAARRELGTLRTSLEAKRKELKAPALERTRLIDAEARSIEAQIRALEDPIDALISAEEQRRERERQARVAAEQERVEEIHRRISRFASYAVRAMGEPSATVEDLIRELVAGAPDDSFAEFRPQAAAAHERALAGLRDLLERVKRQEAEEVRLAEEWARLEEERRQDEERRAAQARADAEAREAREREEAEARRVEQAHQDAERAAEEERLREQRARQEADQRAQREAQEAELRRQREQQERELAEQRRQQQADPFTALLPLTDELIVDNFAGGGGASCGIEQAFGRPVDIAVNHDPEAVAMHRINHPATRHYCESVFKVDPDAITGNQPVGLAWFSPDCTHHSKAKGGAPRSPRVRGLAWVVVRWARRVKPRVIMLENVEEFADWGPLLEDGRPCPVRRGTTFRLWLNQLRAAGYQVEHRELRACDFGAPTTRKRLFVIARRDGLPIVWPSPTHGPGLQPYRTAAECIDWLLPCPSIFERARPLAENTMRRIARGVWKYVINSASPFIVPITHGGDARVHSIDEPMRTVTTANGGEFMLATPFVASPAHSTTTGRAPNHWPAEEPLRTITSTNDKVLVSPTLVQTGYGEREGQQPRSLDIGAPLGTVVAGGQKHALVAALLAKHYGGNETPGTPLDRAMDTVTATDHHALLLKYYGADQDPRLDEPLHTVTTRDRFGLVTMHGEVYAIADIGMRMLQPRELYRAQGFPDGYRIEFEHNGRPLPKHAQVRMCGNSVCPPLAAALVRANFDHERAWKREAVAVDDATAAIAAAEPPMEA